MPLPYTRDLYSNIVYYRDVSTVMHIIIAYFDIYNRC